MHEITEFYNAFLLIIIIIIVIIIIISFMQGIYTYIPETNHVPREYSIFSYSVISIYGAYIASSCVVTILLLR